MIIIQDNREKLPWDFSNFDECEGQVVEYLPTGDYTIYGYETKIIVDRKRNTAEISMNLGTKYKQFCAECERMGKFEQRYIVCEFTLENILEFPKNSGIPERNQKYLKMSGNFILKRIDELERKYNVKFIFCKDRNEAEEKAIELFKGIINGK